MLIKSRIELVIWVSLLGVSTFVFVRAMLEHNLYPQAADATILTLCFMCMGASSVVVRNLWSGRR
jgi:hypothetical protein